jgi:DNA-binding transcriptional MerR regulator
MVCTIMVAEILTTGEVAKMLGLSTQRVRQLEASGCLHPRRTATGVRIYEYEEVQCVLRRRQQGKSRS